MMTNGPNETAKKELRYKQLAELRTLDRDHHNELNNPAPVDGDPVLWVERKREDYFYAKRAMKLRHVAAIIALERQQEDEIAGTGVDPDADAKRIKEERRAEQHRLALERQDAFVANVRARLNFPNGRVGPFEGAWFGPVVPPLDLPNPNEDIRAFANDAQNIHTTVMVEQTKKIVEAVLKTPVPEGYRWNMEECSKTPGEIMVECKLTPRAAWEMNARYCQAETIYEMGVGIYGKVLDSVWQFIKNSDDKEPLKKTLKRELEDNIGMCAQGNLTRLCNILAGYVDGVVQEEAPAEVLGREIPKLLELESIDDRIHQAQKILMRVKLPTEQWAPWLEALLGEENEGVEVRVRERTGDVFITYT